MAFSERLPVGEGARNMIDPARKCQSTPLRHRDRIPGNSRRTGIFSIFPEKVLFGPNNRDPNQRVVGEFP
jgi:hypothetical protein